VPTNKKDINNIIAKKQEESIDILSSIGFIPVATFNSNPSIYDFLNWLSSHQTKLVIYIPLQAGISHKDAPCMRNNVYEHIISNAFKIKTCGIFIDVSYY
jgi:hypothetical protein